VRPPLIRRSISIFLLLMALLFSIVFIFVALILFESVYVYEPMETEDNIAASIYLIISGFFASHYWIFGIKTYRKAKFSKRMYVTLQILFPIFALIIILLSCLFAYDHFSTSFNPFADSMTLSLFLIGAMHIFCFVLLWFPNVKKSFL
jgi:hypothetical protein